MKTGDWARARRLLAEGPARLKASIGATLREEAELLRKEIVTGITEQAPGGEPLKPLSPLTLAARKLAGIPGTKALLARGGMRRAIAKVVQGDEAFVGVPKKARDEEGQQLIDVAQIQEHGAGPFVIRVTAPMRRFLAVLSRAAGRSPTAGSGSGVVIVSIPARPFLGPAFKRFRAAVQPRFFQRVARRLGWGGA